MQGIMVAQINSTCYAWTQIQFGASNALMHYVAMSTRQSRGISIRQVVKFGGEAWTFVLTMDGGCLGCDACQMSQVARCYMDMWWPGLNIHDHWSRGCFGVQSMGHCQLSQVAKCYMNVTSPSSKMLHKLWFGLLQKVWWSDLNIYSCRTDDVWGSLVQQLSD